MSSPIGGIRNVKIFVLDKSGNLRSVNRTCNTATNNSCFAFAIKELINGPSKWEKSNGFTSEIPQGTKVLSIRESANSIQIDLSSNFEISNFENPNFKIILNLKHLKISIYNNSSTMRYCSHSQSLLFKLKELLNEKKRF